MLLLLLIHVLLELPPIVCESLVLSLYFVMQYNSKVFCFSFFN